MEQFRAFHYIIEASFLFLCIADVKTVYNKHLATLRTEQATFSKKKYANEVDIFTHKKNADADTTFEVRTEGVAVRPPSSERHWWW